MSTDFEIVEPDPAALIESLRSFGYSPETSIADLIDNSITAGASEVRLCFHWDGPNSTISILDNGHGMSGAQLRDAMRPGSMNPLAARSKEDLGRFGLGLKTASFSQARVLVVASRQSNSEIEIRRWDLDHVGTSGQWQLLKGATPTTEHLVAQLEESSSGTVVIWDTLDRIVDDRDADDDAARRHFYDYAEMVERHLGMVFHRFLARSKNPLKVWLNDNPIKPWDPFMSNHPATQKLALETHSTPSGSIRIQPYVLPHHSHLSKEEHAAGGGIRGWNAHQGFYIYRADRLLVSGTWFDKNMKQEEHAKLARISIEIDQQMDSDWDIDVRKSRARPPAALRDDLRRIARATRQRAVEVYRHRGKRITKAATRDTQIFVWQKHSFEGNITYRVNRRHDVVAMALEGPKPQADRVRALLDLIERTVPVPQIAIDVYESPEEQADPEASELSPELVDQARHIYEKRRASGDTPEIARVRVMTLEPYGKHPEIAAILESQEIEK